MGGPATARSYAWWALSPYAYATAKLALSTRGRVLIGPFAGMRYPFRSVAALLFDGPSQVGSYESELHAVVEEIVDSAPGLVVNIGAAGGYYAAGLARRLPSAKVIAYETRLDGRGAVDRIADLNGVGERVRTRATCTTAELAGLGDELAGRETCLLVDCEGAEAELIDLDAAPWLAAASALIELHPSVDPEIGAKLSERLAATHETALIDTEPRWASHIPELWQLPGLRDIDRELLVAEYRHGVQQWLWAKPK